ncbi:MAG: lytic transglycosylase domain-containing protein [Jannaschia sp.]
MYRLLLPLILLLSACAQNTAMPTDAAAFRQTLYPGETPRIRALIEKWADHYDLPPSLVHMVIQRESDYRPAARNGPYWGMLQILPATARNMGMRGEPRQLLEADTALKYSLRYLRGAWMVSDGDQTEAMMWYARGYYYEAKRRGLLRETGLRGELWQRHDSGLAPMPALDARGNVVAAVETCEPARGLARLVDRCA